MFKKGRERRQTRRADKKEHKEEKREKRRHNAKVGAAVGAGVAATGLAVQGVQKHKANKAEEARQQQQQAYNYSSDSDSDSSESDFDDGFEVKHLSEYTVLEVQFFFAAIGLESKCDAIEEKQINGAVLISLNATHLQAELGCNSFEIKKITASIEFSYQITEGSKNPEKPTCKPPGSWTEAEVCLVLVAVGMGHKVEKVKEAQITGAVMVSMSSVELKQECGMTSVEVKKFQAVVVKTEKGGCGIEPDVDTMPIEQPELESSKGPNKAAIGVAVGGAVVAGGIGYAAWKKKNKKEEAPPVQEIQQEESVGGSGGKVTVAAASATVVSGHKKEEEEDDDGDCDKVKHPCKWTVVEVKYFAMAIGLSERKVNLFEEKQINGQALVTITKQELQVEYGCSSMEIRKFTAAIEFSIEISENPPVDDDCGCKPPSQWTEVEICLVLVAIGMGSKVRTFKRHHVSGAMLISMSKTELTALKEECGMSSVEVQKFKAVAVKYGHKTTSSAGHCGGGGGSSSSYKKKKTTTVAAVSATAVKVEASGGSCGGVEKPEMKPVVEWTKMEVQYFLIAIGFDKRKCEEFKSAGVTGKVLVNITKAELKGDYGCSEAQIEVFMASLSFSKQVVETECGCKEPEKYTEIEVCMVMISVGLGTKVEKIHKHHLTGIKVIEMKATNLQNKCNMTDYQVTKFKAVFGVVVAKGELDGPRPGGKPGSPSSSRSSSPGSCGSRGSHHKHTKKTVKVTKTTVTKTTHVSH